MVSNIEYLNRIRSISNMCSVSVMAVKNEIQERFEYYVVHDFKPKSNLNNYNELTGQCITQVVQTMMDTGLDSNVFLTRLRELSVENLKFPHGNWYWLTSI